MPLASIDNAQKVEVFRVMLDRRQSLRTMIAAGRYDEIHPLTESVNFWRGRVKNDIDVTLVQFGHTFAPSEIKRILKGHGYRPGYIEELLALGREHPDLQRRIPIASIGSGRLINGRRYAVVLGGSESSRSLGLAVIYRRWSPYYRFAFVRE